ncbi:MAG: Gfo/Idh/MocA family oxidoreductase [Clostridiales bacterium]|nr:Gfo/Idh/MocA family oxidoreductase [Clostridiales bacterium]
MSTEKNLRIGMIGCGVHSIANIYSTLHYLGQPIQAVSARHLDRAQAAADRFGAKHAYDDYHEMLAKEDLDAVFIVTDQYTQAAIAMDCLKAGVNVFVEKPLGMSVEEAKQVADLEKETGLKVMVGFMKRFSPSYVKLKAIMNKKEDFGPALSFMGMFAITSGRPGWDNEVYTKVGGIHYVDLMRWLFGEIVEVHGMTNTVDKEVDSSWLLRFDSGIIGNMFLGGLPAWKRHWEEMCVTGTNGFAKVDNMLSLRYHIDKPVDTIGPRWRTLDEEDVVVTPVSTSGSGGWRDLYLNGYVGEIEHFLHCLKEDLTPECNAADHVRTMELCEKMLAALKSC